MVFIMEKVIYNKLKIKYEVERMLLLYINRLKKTCIIVLMLILAIGLNGCTKKPEGLVAEVNGEGITEEDYNLDLEVHKNFYEGQFGEGSLSKVDVDGKTAEDGLKEDILNKLILETLIAQEAEKNHISVTNEEIEEKLDQIRGSLGGEEDLQEFLEANEIPFDYFKKDAKKEYLFEKHKGRYLGELNIGEKEAKKYFDENKEKLVILRASHILLKDEDQAKSVLEKLNKGEEFASLALTESLDNTSAVKGGDLGYFSKGTFGIKEFEDAAFALKVGEVSGLVETEAGYHIIYLQDRKDSFEDLKNEITMLLKEEDYAKHIQGLRKQAKIKTYIEIGNKENN